MILYHASTLVIERPVIMNRFKTLDFGTGFYTTPNEEQARDFARKVHRRRKGVGRPIVNIYEFDETLARKELVFLEFEEPDEEWLRFVVHNRRFGRSDACTADVVVGPVADDDVFATVALFEAGQIDEEMAIKRFKVKKLFSQVLLCNERALVYLRYKTSYVEGVD